MSMHVAHDIGRMVSTSTSWITYIGFLSCPLDGTLTCMHWPNWGKTMDSSNFPDRVPMALNSPSIH